jgi:hypothetical protein
MSAYGQFPKSLGSSASGRALPVGDRQHATRSRPSAERRQGPLRRAKRTLAVGGILSNRSSVSIDERAIVNLKVSQHSQSRYAMRPGTLSSLLHRSGTSGAIEYLLSALANR